MTNVYLQPGEWFCSDRPAKIDTILGSCLGIVMRHAGGATCVSHCVLPRRNGQSVSPGCDARFVDHCLERMLAFFRSRGISHRDVDVKLFGGSQLLFNDPASSKPSVGRQNLESAIAFLEREGLEVSEQDVGGNRGRRIVVDTVTGQVEVSYMQPFGGARLSLEPAA